MMKAKIQQTNKVDMKRKIKLIDSNPPVKKKAPLKSEIQRFAGKVHCSGKRKQLE
jgi:hypothetical protein